MKCQLQKQTWRWGNKSLTNLTIQPIFSNQATAEERTCVVSATATGPCGSSCAATWGNILGLGDTSGTGSSTWRPVIRTSQTKMITTKHYTQIIPWPRTYDTTKNTAIRSSYKRGRSHLFMGALLMNLRVCMIVFDSWCLTGWIRHIVGRAPLWRLDAVHVILRLSAWSGCGLTDGMGCRNLPLGPRLTHLLEACNVSFPTGTQVLHQTFHYNLVSPGCYAHTTLAISAQSPQNPGFRKWCVRGAILWAYCEVHG